MFKMEKEIFQFLQGTVQTITLYRKFGQHVYISIPPRYGTNHALPDCTLPSTADFNSSKVRYKRKTTQNRTDIHRRISIPPRYGTNKYQLRPI